MKYFRDPRVTLLALVCVALTALLVAAVRIGRSHDNSLPTTNLDRGAALADIDALRTRLVELPGVVAAPDARLRPWATDLAVLAAQAAERRKLQGAGSSDGLVRALQELSADATELAGTPTTDTLALRGAAGKVYTDADMLTAILGGARPDILLATPDPSSPAPSATSASSHRPPPRSSPVSTASPSPTPGGSVPAGK